MTPPVLAIVQMRMGSTRLPKKMRLPLGHVELWQWAVGAAIEAFGRHNVMIAMVASRTNRELYDLALRLGMDVRQWPIHEADVLLRFRVTAAMRHPSLDTMIVRVTPDDPFKDPEAMRRVVAGETWPVELGCEAFTYRALCEAHEIETDPKRREHLTLAFGTTPPAPPPGAWTVDTPADYEAAVARVEREHLTPYYWREAA